MTTLTHTSFLPVIPGRHDSLFEAAGRTVKNVASRLSRRAATTPPQTASGGSERQRQAPKVVYMRFYA